jgi:tetratricopeptide (TPR) repeat protein
VPPLARNVGARADEAWLRARLSEARSAGDATALRIRCAALGRWLASRDRNLDEAVDFAVTALSLGPDNDLRRELSSWLESLGEPARAATVLEPLVSEASLSPLEIAQVHLRVGMLEARSGDAAPAVASLRKALTVDGDDALPAELIGALAGWAPEAVSPTAAAEAYVDSARRRATQWQHDAELEDLWRALAADPSSRPAIGALAAALERRGRPSVAAEVRRSIASGPAGSEAAAQNATSLSDVARLAEEAMAAGDRASPAPLERAISAIGPRAGWCRALADALDKSGQAKVAIGWTQRYLALKPGDVGAVEQLLERLVRIHDAERLGDALAWLMSQPLPMPQIDGLFARALDELSRTDSDRAVVVARRALDVFGPRSALMRDAMLAASARAYDDAFAAAIFERWLACGAQGADRRQLFVRLAELYERLADDEAQARTIARALIEDASWPSVDSHLARLDGLTMTPDGQVWRAQARAVRLAATGEGDAATPAWRELGAALWDLAEDREAAVAAWQRATTGPAGAATFAVDVVAFAGASVASEILGRFIDSQPDDPTAGALAADLGRTVLSMGEARLALELAGRGLVRSPSCADALEIAETSAERATAYGRLSELYDLVGGRALGRFGRRAAHYRGARFFERQGEHALALKHAAEAFRALPAEGSSLHLLARAADRGGDPARAIELLEQVAAACERPQARAHWLLRAARLFGSGPQVAKRSFELFLGAVVAFPDVDAIAQLGGAARAVLESEPDEREALNMRFARAAAAVTSGLEGPSGARLANAFAAIAIEIFDDAETAFRCVERAFACDAESASFAPLVRLCVPLARAAASGDRVDALLLAAETTPTATGVDAFRLLAGIAAAAGDESMSARAVVAAALCDPQDDVLVAVADAAVRAVPALAPRLEQGIPAARRAQALVSLARARLGAGAPREATGLFERASGLVEGSALHEVERELRVARSAAGRPDGADELADPDSTGGGTTRMRAERWTEIAERREARADLAGAVRALLEAARLEPDAPGRWTELERVAELAGDDEARVLALEQIVARTKNEGRASVLKRLARAHGLRNDVDAAERAWREVVELEAHDDDADQALESILAAGNRYAELAAQLALRCERLCGDPARRETLRALRLRRAAILEQRLGRVADACTELEQLLAEAPDSPGAVRYLADLLERQGEHARSAHFWSRAADYEHEPAERDDLHLRAARAFAAAGQFSGTLESASRIAAESPRRQEALEVQREAASSLGLDLELGSVLEELARGVHLSPWARSDYLVEAALSSARLGDLDRALVRAGAAAEASPERALPQLLARGLEYRLRGAGAPEDARRTIEELARITEPLGADDVALRSFLLAEALDVVRGGGAGAQELQAAQNVVGEHALLTLGAAERLVAQGQIALAMPLYRASLGGSFLGLRSPGKVALTAADTAIRAGLWENAAMFLEVAERHDEVREAASARRRMLEGQVVLPEATVASGEAVSLEELQAAVLAATTPGERARGRLALGRARFERGDHRGAEPLLQEALADGLIEAGDLLDSLLSGSPERLTERVRVRRQQVAIDPGDVGRLEALRAAALADGDRVYASAVEHVLRAFDSSAGPLAPPMLATQLEQPGILAFLMRPSMDAPGEALGLLWEGGAQLFARATTSYAITGIERIIAGPQSAIARLYEIAVRALDAPKVPLFVMRGGSGPPSAQVAVLVPPSVIVSGDVREDTTALRYELGRGICGALAQNVLRIGLSPPEGRTIVEALRAAFGPPDIGRRVDPNAARVAESYWQVLPPRMQRRIQQLLGGGNLPDHGELVARAHQSGRRVGMFLCGDFGYATRALLAESNSGFVAKLSDLRDLCQTSPELADLLRLATSAEYASARWHDAAQTPGGSSSGRYGFF